MKKNIFIFIICFVIVIIVFIFNSGFSSNKVFVDNPAVNTCSIEKGEVNLQLRIFTNFKLNTKEKVAKINAKANSILLDSQDIVLKDHEEGVYVYYLELVMIPNEKEADYEIEIRIDDQIYKLKNIKNKDYRYDDKNIISGMDNIGEFSTTLQTRLYFDNKANLNDIKVNNILGEISENSKNEKEHYIMAKGSLGKPQIVGYIYSYGGQDYCAGNEIQYKDYTPSSIKEIWEK